MPVKEALRGALPIAMLSQHRDSSLVATGEQVGGRCRGPAGGAVAQELMEAFFPRIAQVGLGVGHLRCQVFASESPESLEAGTGQQPCKDEEGTKDSHLYGFYSLVSRNRRRTLQRVLAAAMQAIDENGREGPLDKLVALLPRYRSSSQSLSANCCGKG
eukprot:RCo029512